MWVSNTSLRKPMILRLPGYAQHEYTNTICNKDVRTRSLMRLDVMECILMKW